MICCSWHTPITNTLCLATTLYRYVKIFAQFFMNPYNRNIHCFLCWTLNSRNQRQFKFPLSASSSSSSCRGFSRACFLSANGALTFCGLFTLSCWMSITLLFHSLFHLRELCDFSHSVLLWNFFRLHSHTAFSLSLFCSRTAYTLKTNSTTTARHITISGQAGTCATRNKRKAFNARHSTAGVRDYSRAFVISTGRGMNIQSAMLKAIKKLWYN